jgi:hypothetical protein
MANACRFNLLVVCATAFTVAAGLSPAQTPGQMEYERQQREYWRQQEQQRQEQQRQQQLMQDNARRQQEESSRINAPSGGGGAGGASAGARGQSADPSNAAAWSAARAMWEKRPALAPENNPLLIGRWTRPADTPAKSSDPFAGLVALAKGGMCEVLFGGGVFEFRRDTLVGMDQRTPEQELDKVEYRGGGKHIVVLPKTSIKLIEFDFETPDRIRWTAQPNCVLVRVKTDSTRTAATAAATAAVQATARPKNATAPAASPANASAAGVLSFSVGTPSADNNVAGRKLWVLKEDAQVALIKGGVTNTPYGTVLQTWMRACAAHAPACQQGALALKPYGVGMATTDASGHAQTPPLPLGRYWVLSDAKVANKHLMWNQPVDVGSSEKLVTLDERNAMPVD